MIARIQDAAGAEGVDDGAELGIDRPRRRPPKAVHEAGLDLTCTKVAVDFQSISLNNAAERITAGLQSLTDACGADAVFVALLEHDWVNKVYAGRSTFSACNPEMLKGRELSDFPWIKSRLDHLRLLENEIGEGTYRASARRGAPREPHDVGALLVVGFSIRSSSRSPSAPDLPQPRTAMTREEPRS